GRRRGPPRCRSPVRLGRAATGSLPRRSPRLGSRFGRTPSAVWFDRSIGRRPRRRRPTSLRSRGPVARRRSIRSLVVLAPVFGFLRIDPRIALGEDFPDVVQSATGVARLHGALVAGISSDLGGHLEQLEVLLAHLEKDLALRAQLELERLVVIVIVIVLAFV